MDCSDPQISSLTQQKASATPRPAVHFMRVLKPQQQMAGVRWHLLLTILLPFLINSQILQFTCVHKCHQMSSKCQGLGHEDRRGSLGWLCVQAMLSWRKARNWWKVILIYESDSANLLLTSGLFRAAVVNDVLCEVTPAAACILDQYTGIRASVMRNLTFQQRWYRFQIRRRMNGRNNKDCWGFSSRAWCKTVTPSKREEEGAGEEERANVELGIGEQRI